MKTRSEIATPSCTSLPVEEFLSYSDLHGNISKCGHRGRHVGDGGVGPPGPSRFLQAPWMGSLWCPYESPDAAKLHWPTSTHADEHYAGMRSVEM